MFSRSSLVTISLPIPWIEFGFPEVLGTRTTALSFGDTGWAWDTKAPRFPIPLCDPQTGVVASGWDIDHVVLLVPSLLHAMNQMYDIGLSPSLRMDVAGRATAFFRVGTLLEVIESPIRAAALYGVALVTEEPLEVVALRWRSQGRDVTDPAPAVQPGRRILTVRDTEAALAVMSPDLEVRPQEP